MPVADRRLSHLRDQRLRVTQQHVEHFPVTTEFLLEPVARQSIRMTGALHDRAARRGFAAHEQRDTEHTVIAHHGNLRGSSVLHDIQQ